MVEAPLERCFSVASVREQARRVLPRAVFDFTDGGAEDERTLRRNVSAFDEIALLPRPLNGAAERDLSVELFGRRHAMPVMIGPTGLAGLMWPDGEAAAARAAAKAGVAYCLSHGSVCTIEHLAATGAATAMDAGVHLSRPRLYPRNGRARRRHRLRGAGADDRQSTDRQSRARPAQRLHHTAELSLVAAAGDGGEMALAHPHARGIAPHHVWQLRAAGHALGRGERRAAHDRDAGPFDVLARCRDVARSWRGPLLLKGVLHPAEARPALEHGVDGIIVSNHGGRQLDGAVSSIEALPAIVEAVAGAAPVLVDGGFRRGVDVVKALALGADRLPDRAAAALGLAIAGEAGVAHVGTIPPGDRPRDGLMGAARISDLGRDNSVPRICGRLPKCRNFRSSTPTSISTTSSA